MLPPCLLAVGSLALLIIMPVDDYGEPLLDGVVVLAALAVSVWWIIYLKFHEFGVTNKRVIHKRGIISRKTGEMKLGSIETVEIDQGVAGRIFGYGTIKLTGRGISTLEFVSIDNPMFVKRRIEGISSPVD